MEYKRRKCNNVKWILIEKNALSWPDVFVLEEK